MSVLVAGIGNVFLGDDGFGVAVAHALRSAVLPNGVRVVDVGTRARDLTYTLLEGWDLVVLVDAARRGRAPGTLTLLELSLEGRGVSILEHGLRPEHVLESALAQGARLERVVIVGCEPATLDTGSGTGAWNLSPPVSAAVEPAARMVERLVFETGRSACMS